MSGFGYDVLGFGSGGVAPPETDDDFNRTSFLSHFDGANNGVNKAFDDGSASNHTITANGNVTQGSFGPFARPEGYWGVVFDGAGDRVRANWSDNIASAAFTIEAWVFISGAMSQYDCIAWLQESTHGGNGDNGFCIRANNANTIEFGVFNGSTIYNTISSAISLNEWHYLTLSKSGTTMYSSVDGTVTSRSAPSALNNAKVLNIGAADASGSISYAFNGVISNVRFLKGTALYTSNFTVPTSPLTAITNTKFLGCQSNRFVDNSANNYAITTAGNAAVSAFGPFLTDAAYDPAVNGASLYAPTYTDYLRIPNSAEFELDANFSVEFWVNLDSDFNSSTSVMFWADNNNQTQIGQNSGTELYFYRGANIIANTNVLAKARGWNHIALCRSGSVISLYCNGVRIGTASNTDTVDFSDAYVMTYVPNANQYGADGFMSDLRILKGSSAYDASQTTLTVPTAPLTAITNTKLLLNMADGQAIDSAAQNNLTLFGNAKLSTGQAKFGDTSLYLNGSNDAAKIVKSNFSFGTGDFTVEFWYYGTTVVDAPLLDMRSSGANPEARVAIFFTNNSGNVGYYVTNSTRITSNTTVATNTWTHIALVRSSAVTRFYFNGTQDNQTYSDTIDLLSSPVTIGLKFNLDSNNNVGYYDDIRISNMARYTSSFTAPPRPFPDQGQV